ncbi:retinal pigment epithelial membrane protein-domain-containing protein [Ochromonadaceae sp. CCMP2298]|nr:retinal pigment epithelial membrane protein-domain-containing protein [Ochromonadaceae sp. CCMP2298]
MVNSDTAYAYIDSMKSPSKRRAITRAGAKLLHARDSDGLYSETEMVTLNPLLKGRAYRYSYGMTMFPPSVLQQYVRPLGEDCTDWGIVKMDHEAAVAAYRADGAEISTSGSHATAEDHGVLLAQVYDGTRREAFLLVLDAQSMQERARCYSGMRLPVQFHGKFIEKF